MMNAKIKNTFDRTLSVGGVEIRKDATALVRNWAKVRISAAVKTWIDMGIIEVVEVTSDEGDMPGGLPGLPLPSTVPVPAGLPGLPSPVVNDDAEKERIIAALAKHDIEKTKRSSLENLRKELEAVENKS